MWLQKHCMCRQSNPAQWLSFHPAISVFTQERPPPALGGGLLPRKASGNPADWFPVKKQDKLWNRRTLRLDSKGEALTQLVFCGVVRDHHDVQFEAQVALPDGVDVCDVGTLLGHGPHELLKRRA